MLPAGVKGEAVRKNSIPAVGNATEKRRRSHRRWLKCLLVRGRETSLLFNLTKITSGVHFTPTSLALSSDISFSLWTINVSLYYKYIFFC